MMSTEDESRDVAEVELPRLQPTGQTLVVSVGSKLSTAVRAVGQEPVAMRLVRHGAVSLAAAHAAAANASGAAVARVLRVAAGQVAERARLELLRGSECPVLGAAPITRAVIRLGAVGRSRATIEQVRSATETLAETWVADPRARNDQAGIETMMIGAAVLEAILDGLGAREIAVDEEAAREHEPGVD
jgi:hypothetical protein